MQSDSSSILTELVILQLGPNNSTSLSDEPFIMWKEALNTN